MAIERFEDIKGWQAGRELVRTVYAATGEGSFARDYRLRDQIQGAAISILANIAEGFDCDTNSEMIRFLGFARRSASEVQSLLYIARDLSYITQDAFDKLYGEAESTKALIGGFVRYLKSNPDPRKVRG
jgi:four helix bundle protein